MNLWWNEYIGLPYKEKGRDRSGIDCWGLARLVYKEQFDIELPNLDDSYDLSEQDALVDLMAIHKEDWKATNVPNIGDVVVFKILGQPTHVGIVCGAGTFLHAREGSDSVIERLDSGAWKHRIEGFYTYSKKDVSNSLVLSARPHPLKVERIDGFMPLNMSVAEISTEIKNRLGINAPFNYDAIIFVDGKVIPKEEWEVVYPTDGQRVEYRAVARGGNTLRTIATIAVIVAAVYFAPAVAAYATGTAVGAASATAVAITQVGLSMAGSLLVNAIFPVRFPNQNQNAQNPGSAQAQNLLQGGSNSLNPYGAIPVVLGKIRFTPPYGGKPYVESTENESYLRGALVWGYGELQVSDIRVGSSTIDSLEGSQYVTVSGATKSDANSSFGALYAADVSQQFVNVKLDGSELGSPWVERVISDECDSISAQFHFPEGLRALNLRDGSVHGWGIQVDVQSRQLDSDTLAPITDWGNVQGVFHATSRLLNKAYFNIDNDAELEPVYRWARFSVDEYSKLIVRYGAFTIDPNAEPTGDILTRQQESSFGFNNVYTRLPPLGDGEEELYQICMYGDTVFTTVDRRSSGGATFTGCNLTISGLTASISSGTILRSVTNSFIFGNPDTPYYKRKDAFSYTLNFNVPKGKHEVRVRRASDGTVDFIFPGSDVEGRRYSSCFLTSLVGYENRRFVVEPKPLAMTSFKIKATNQINGNLEGVTGTVLSVCKDWNGSSWVVRPTRNPASLFRYVLQHPANAQAVSDSELDLVSIQEWHSYCQTNEFMYDNVLSQQQSLLEVLRDICAAGRASPTMKDGKWTIIVDKPRLTIAQYFTPHNSWGFESIKSLPKLPHAFRVEFNNSEKGYQPDEMIVYNDGYNEGNATLFEGLFLPGVTTKKAIYKHARFHFAQLKLRPETYTLNVDIEHLICNRGDRVKVNHDVPLWGIGSGRIRNRNSSTQLELDEAMPMDAGVQYSIRIRLEDGSSITRTVVAKIADGYYTTIDLTSSVTTTEAKANNLFMFGTLSEETNDLVVLAIEPSNNMTARLTLVDYSPDVYNSDTEVIPAFDSNITLPPLIEQKRIIEAPTISSMISDESVLIKVAPRNFQTVLKVGYTNPKSLSADVKYVQAQIKYTSDAGTDWGKTTVIKISDGAVTFTDVEEGESYNVRLRYADDLGYFSPWTVSSNHVVVGKTTPPSNVTGLVSTVDSNIGVTLNWDNLGDIDFDYYEIRSGASWDSGQFLAKVTGTTYKLGTTKDGSLTYYVKAVDTSGNYSVTPASVAVTINAPEAPVVNRAFEKDTLALSWGIPVSTLNIDYYEIRYGAAFLGGTLVGRVKTTYLRTKINWLGDRNFHVAAVDIAGNIGAVGSLTVTVSAPANTSSATYVYTDTALTTATITLDWVDVVPTHGLAFYEISYDSTTKTTASDTITLPADWIGDKNFTIKTVDLIGNKSSGFTFTATKQLPDPVTNFRAQVIDNNVLFYWTLPAKTSLPIAHVLLKKGASYATATSIGYKAGEFTSIQETRAGTYTYWAVVVDTDNNESSPVALTTVVAEPPDFIFNAEYTSILNGTKSSAIKELDYLVMPVNTTETWASHFTSRGWTTPSAQISAGYPYYIQPTVTPSYYEEVFDYGTILASSKITLAWTSETVAGTPTVTSNISVSIDGVTYTNYDGVSEIYATNFRFIKIRINVTQTLQTAIYKISNLTVRLDSKQKTDSDTQSCLSTDTLGTIANFNKEFIDVTSINVTPSSTTPVTVVYDFQDDSLNATYSVTSNVCTVTATAHGLITGQKVRVYFSSGTALSGIFTVTGYTANTFTFAITTANTTGSCLIYPQGFRIYLFNSSGTRVNGTASWTVRGY